MIEIGDKEQFLERVWRELAPSEFTWERRALAKIREQLTPLPPLGVWTGFEFMALNGATFEGDALIFNAQGAWLLRMLNLHGWLDPGRWSWVHVGEDQRRRVIDNPLSATQEVAQNLRELLSERMKGANCPPIHALVVLTDHTLKIEGGVQPEGLFAAPDGPAALPNVMDALNHSQGPGLKSRDKLYGLDALKRFVEAVDNAELDSTGKYPRVGDRRLKRLLETSESHQDYEAVHARNNTKRARARVFFAQRDHSENRQERLMQAAKREHRVLETLAHPNVLHVEHFLDVKARPTLLFEHIPNAVRLDHYLQANTALSITQRLDVLRQIADALLYAHRKQIIHRALGPQCVLVVPDADGAPKTVKVMNWQTSAQADHLTSATRHVHDYLATDLYLAPEHATAPEERTDVFGLGVLAYALMTGRAPETSASRMIWRLMKQRGLRLSADIDGVHPALEALVLRATNPLVRERFLSVAAFVEALEAARVEILNQDDHSNNTVDPLEAGAGDVLDERYEVVRRLGAGASAVALLVRDSQDREVVLKVAQSANQTARLQAEARDLKKLNHPQIIPLLGTDEIGGRFALILRFAGKTLRERLRESGRLSLDDLLRFGEHLCVLMATLENQRVFHRDIKPENLGVGDGQRELMLFDFSLADAPIDAVEVGTTIYRDPFVVTRQRWDTHADRYAAAVTLYEMATHALPVWGDGVSPPHFDPDATLQLDADRFPAALRTELTAFFKRALAREIQDRFDHGEDMLAAWRQLRTRATTTDHGLSAQAIELATLDTPLAQLSLSDAAASAVDRLNLITAADLLNQPPQSFYFLRGAGAQVRDELATLRRALAARLDNTDSRAADARAAGDRSQDASTWSIDRAMKHLLDQIDHHKSINEEQGALLWRALGLDDDVEPFPWASRDAVAQAAGQPVAAVAQALTRAAACWGGDENMVALRDDVVALIKRAEGVLDDEALARGLIGLRGSLEDDTARRMRVGAVLARAVVMAELAPERPKSKQQPPRRASARHAGRVFIATRPALLDTLSALGTMADLLADENPLRSPAQAYEQLADELVSAGLSPLTRARLHPLAVQASEHAALSSRQEIYPCGMSADRALRLASGVLVSGGPLDEAELRERVQARYPHAEPLPTGIELEQLLREANIPLQRHSSGHGFVSIHPGSHSASQGLSAWTSATAADQEADRATKKIAYCLRYGGFLALMVSPAHAEAVADALTKRHSALVRCSLDDLWLDTMDKVVTELGADWNTVYGADAPDANDADRQIFETHFLSAAVVPQARQALLDLPVGSSVLLTHPGLMARYRKQGAMDALEALRDRAGTPEGPHAVVLLLPADQQHEGPTIDGAVVPVIGPSQWMRAPRSWTRALLKA